MKFGPVRLDDAHGARLAHSIKAGRRYAKGRVLGPHEIEDLRATGMDEVVVATLGPDDVSEDEAAAAIARRFESPTIEVQAPATGRCNLFASRPGLFVASRPTVDALNAVDPAITLATLADGTAVRAGRMVATVKIIPFAVPRSSVEAVLDIAHLPAALTVQPFRPMRVAMISTRLPTLKESVIAKTERITRERLHGLGGTLETHVQVPHEEGPLAEALLWTEAADLILVFGASAVADEEDVIPAAIRSAGGAVGAVGMPVDPGNLLCIGSLNGVPVIGAPGCARSPAENGFDWVLRRLAAGLPVDRKWVGGLGVGGLLMEIERPSPRDRVPVIVLAAGQSSRMGDDNKLTRELDGRPVVAHAVDAVLQADVGPVTVVTGHDAGAVRSALGGRDVAFAHNPDFAAGMSTSLHVGLEAAGGGSGALVVLGDMPDIEADGLVRIVEAFRAGDGERIVAARDRQTGRRGNPVLWPRSLWPELLALEGDTGARDVLVKRADEVTLVEMDGAALDLDTPEAFARRAGR